ncbi:hypothetical protein TrCOL_g8030 [Triparma columacea]|uniref:RING-type domain-containing protein n=1 Tax=Triparma columacea TaxID=722753 RepID=A0A9W7L4W8_9STRA|nr:hypothetical protein TrCOL_g8030 [Triparma columacea]
MSKGNPDELEIKSWREEDELILEKAADIRSTADLLGQKANGTESATCIWGIPAYHVLMVPGAGSSLTRVLNMDQSGVINPPGGVLLSEKTIKACKGRIDIIPASRSQPRRCNSGLVPPPDKVFVQSPLQVNVAVLLWTYSRTPNSHKEVQHEVEVKSHDAGAGFFFSPPGLRLGKSGSTVFSAKITGLLPDTIYTFRVRTHVAAETSDWAESERDYAVKEPSPRLPPTAQAPTATGAPAVPPPEASPPPSASGGEKRIYDLVSSDDSDDDSDNGSCAQPRARLAVDPAAAGGYSDDDDDDDDEKCIFCDIAVADIVLLPCGHRFTCASCYKDNYTKDTPCPICSGLPQDFVQLTKEDATSKGCEAKLKGCTGKRNALMLGCGCFRQCTSCADPKKQKNCVTCLKKGRVRVPVTSVNAVFSACLH